MSEAILTVGNKGEIYTSAALRNKVGMRKGGKVRARVSGDRLIIEPIPTLEELVKAPLVTIGADEAERLSEKAQKEEGAYG
ncbi:MAG: AbrB/MazE/SpoVT family DNA-binding domain-containing protein [Thaumarchaeota archaeon]|nr:MAG: AbrB/MazE/SpoVT family DNA-binding domain-containing protein [Nitrososphaerota archaeon]